MSSNLEKIAACRELYVQYGGGFHQRIQREMRGLGFHDFSRRVLYARGPRPGWPERFGWNAVEGRGDTATQRRRDHSEKIPASRRRRVAASSSDAFHQWLKTIPSSWTWDWRHMRELYKKLQLVTDGNCKRLMIFMPPRHGKSEVATRYTAWRLMQNPALRVIVASYNQALANLFSRKVRNAICEAVAWVRKKSSPPYEGGVAAVSADGVVLSHAHECACMSEPPGKQKAEPPASAGGRHAPNTQVRGTGAAVTDEARNQPPSMPAEFVPPAYAGGSASDAGGSIFPFTKSRPANRVAEWETGLNGGLRAVGVGGGIAGYGAGLVIIDDPVKSRAEAESKTIRDKTWQWFNNDIYTRLEPDASIILIQTRWHEDDLAGRLLRESENGGEKWEVLNLPALARPQAHKAEPPASAGGTNAANTQVSVNRARIAGKAEPPASTGGEHLPHNRVSVNHECTVSVPDNHSTSTVTEVVPPAYAGGSALWPERFSVKRLTEIKTQLGSYNFNALYQQDPIPPEGATFKKAWFERIVDTAPAGLSWCRGYDLAISLKNSADYTASFRVARDGAGNLYIADGFRARIDYPEQRRYIIERIMAEKNTSHGIESAIHGKALFQELLKEDKIVGRAFREVKVDTDKLTRALGWANTAEAGKVVLVRGAWIQDFLEELLRFPAGRHDDQIDAVSIAVMMLAEKKPISAGF